VTHHASQVQSAASVPVLREGSRVPLIAVDGWRADGTAVGQTVTFILAEDLSLDGKVLARAGDIASGQVAEDGAGNAPSEARSLALRQVVLRAGNVTVPLRSSQVRDLRARFNINNCRNPARSRSRCSLHKACNFPRLNERLPRPRGYRPWPLKRGGRSKFLRPRFGEHLIGFHLLAYGVKM
jgi:hypothetical protein